MLKNLVFRAMRPGLQELQRELRDLRAVVESLRAAQNRRESWHQPAVWRGGADGRAIDSAGRESPEMTRKYGEELAYWLSAARGADPAFVAKASGGAGDMHEQFGVWGRRRLKELGDQFQLDDDGLRAWCRERVAVEIGCGPHPSVVEAEFRVALAVDPLADAYVREKIAAERAGVVYVSAVGEQLPLASGSADIVIIENCLDHAEDPRRVLGEIARVLKHGGFLWLLVDFMDYRDHMHPSPMREAALRGLLAEHGFVVKYLASWGPGSHPKAEKQCRVLAARG